MKLSLLIVLISLTVLDGCGSGKRGGYYKDDGPPKRVMDELHRVKDAVPGKEPLSKTGNKPYKIAGRWYHPMSSAAGYRQQGVASWYGRKFHGRRTSSGEPYDMNAMTAAHPTLPLPSYVQVTNLNNGRRVILKVNDRGPFLHNRIIDLSYAAATKLDIVSNGTGLVEVIAIDQASPDQTSSSVVGSVLTKKRVDYSSPEDAQNVIIYAQLGAFSVQENAVRLQHKLESDNFNAVKIHHDPEQSGLLYRVRLGPFDSVEQADQIVRRLNDYGYTAKLMVEQ